MKFLLIVFLLFCLPSYGLIVHNSTGQSNTCLNVVGSVGSGSGVYLGNGFVLTAAHVGCFPFILDRQIFQPYYDSWKIIESKDKKTDLAIFKIKILDSSNNFISIKSVDKEKELIITGTGYDQKTASYM